MKDNIKIPKRILGTLLNSASAGVVPRIGLEYLAIGRNEEISALIRDMDNIAIGMGAFRFISGKYGSGKSFLMGLCRQNAVERGFVTCDADLSPERRFQGTHGQGIATYRELIKNLSCKSMPENNALPAILGTWLNSLRISKMNEFGSDISSDKLNESVKSEIFKIFDKLRGFVCGFDFAAVLSSYYSGYIAQDEAKMNDALRWIRGEYNQKSELSETDLGIKTIINDQNWYDFLKLFAVFFREIGYKGLLVFIDECVNLYKIPNRISRENNYEKILSMFNDTMQGKAEGIGFFLAATPQMIEDNRKGLFSYEALRSRLAAGNFTPQGKRNLLSPIIYLEKLSGDELFALCKRLNDLHSLYYAYSSRITDNDIESFLNEALNKAGAAEMITPREITRDFLNILDILYTNPEMDINAVLNKRSTEKKVVPEDENDSKDDFDTFFDMSEIKL